MTDVQIAVTFDGNPGMAFTQGEDRNISLILSDAVAKTPINLTGAVVGINLPMQGGGSVKRTSGNVVAQCANVAVTPANSVTLTDHGFVTQDPVQVSVVGGGTLPGGLAPATPYTLNVLDGNTFQFLDSTGAVVPLSSQGSGAFNIVNSNDIVIANAAAGQVTFNLRAAVSTAVNAALAQNFEVFFIISGKERIAVLQGLLDILNQPVS